MNSLKKILDECMNIVYSSSMSLMDFLVITTLSSLGSTYSQWVWLILIPWIWYSFKQKIKYDILNGK